MKSVAYLERMGVPSVDAKALVADLTKAGE